MNVIPCFLPEALHEVCLDVVDAFQVHSTLDVLSQGFLGYCQSVLKPALHNVLETGSQRLFPRAASLEVKRLMPPIYRGLTLVCCCSTCPMAGDTTRLQTRPWRRCCFPSTCELYCLFP
jgi:hypothetical protein